jgi:4-amino-4-deoxy-L-arabinose transferase-like glycosyltransferase
VAVSGRTHADEVAIKGVTRSLAIWTALALTCLTAVALGLRLYALDARSLWLDEILTSQPAHLRGPADVITWSQAAINQMPFFYMFTWFFGHWGDSGVILRLPPAIFGTLLVPAIYLLARDLFGVRAGLVAALMGAVLPFAVWYSQEARNYSLLMLMTTLQMWFAFRSVKRGRIIDWLGLAVFSILNLYTHYVALAATAAVALYIFVFVLTDALRGAPARAKVAVIGLVGLALAAAALVHWRPLLTEAHDYALAHARGHRALVIAIAFAIAIAVIVLAILVWQRSPRLRSILGARRLRQIELAAITGTVVGLVYLPWLPSLLVFLGRPDQSLGQIHVAHPPGLPELAATLGALSLTGVLLIALCGGLVALGAWAFKGKAAESLLVLVWLAVPLAVFGYSAGRNLLAIDPRYLAFVVPATLVVIGAAAEVVAVWMERLAARLRQPWLTGPRAGAVAGVVVVALLLAQTLPALASSYGEPKNDYRATAQRIAAASPPGSVVIAVGAYSDWTVICLKYYFRQLHSDVEVVDGPLIDQPAADQLRSRHGIVWGVVIFPSTDQRALVESQGPETLDFVDATQVIYLLRPSDAQPSPTTQALTLLRWEVPLQPALAPSIAVIEASATQ